MNNVVIHHSTDTVPFLRELEQFQGSVEDKFVWLVGQLQHKFADVDATQHQVRHALEDACGGGIAHTNRCTRDLRQALDSECQRCTDN